MVGWVGLGFGWLEVGMNKGSRVTSRSFQRQLAFEAVMRPFEPVA